MPPDGPESAPGSAGGEPASTETLDPAATSSGPQNGPDLVAQLRREATAHRRERNEARAERDALRARLDRVDHDRVVALAGERLSEGADLLLTTSMDQLRGEDGELDEAKVSTAIDSALEAHPNWARPERTVDFGAGVRPPSNNGSSFGAGLKAALRQSASE